MSQERKSTKNGIFGGFDCILAVFVNLQSKNKYVYRNQHQKIFKNLDFQPGSTNFAEIVSQCNQISYQMSKSEIQNFKFIQLKISNLFLGPNLK